MPFSKFNEAMLRQILQQFFDASFNSIVITSADQGYPILYANPEFCRMTGYTLDELVGKTPKLFQGEKTNKKILSRLKSTIEAGKIFHGATTNYRKNGEAYPVEWNISPIFDATGKITHYLSIQKDLSALKLVVSRLKSTNEHFREFLSDISQTIENTQATELNTALTEKKQAVTQELLDNSRLYTPALRSDENIDLFAEGEFFDCSHDLNGMLSEEGAELEIISAQEYANQHQSNHDMRQLLEIILETNEKIDLLGYSKNPVSGMMEIGQNIHDIANDIFYFDDFVGISSVLGQLGTHTCSHASNELNPMLVEIYRALMKDLETWVISVFIEKTANSIHELDASIISSARQLLMFLK